MVKPQPDFALDEIVRTLEELSAVEEKEEGFATTQEIATIKDWTVEKVRKYLNVLKEEGRLECKHKRMRSLDGRTFGRPAYRIIPERGEEGKE